MTLVSSCRTNDHILHDGPKPRNTSISHALLSDTHKASGVG